MTLRKATNCLEPGTNDGGYNKANLTRSGITLTISTFVTAASAITNRHGTVYIKAGTDWDWRTCQVEFDA